jgi:hypothetical protein
MSNCNNCSCRGKVIDSDPKVACNSSNKKEKPKIEISFKSLWIYSILVSIAFLFLITNAYPN